MPTINLNPQLVIDDVDETQKAYLPYLVRTFKKNGAAMVTQVLFDTFKARGWVTGDPGMCKLTSTGYQAALRILGEDADRTAPKKKVKPVQAIGGYIQKNG